MKIFEWMQNRLNGSNGKKKPTSISANYYMLHEPCKQEFSDWPQQALLAIGTFGNNNLKEDSGNDRTNSTTTEDSSSFQEFSLEEVGNLQNELKNINLGADQQEEENDPINDLINERLNSEHSSLEPEGKEETERFSDGSNINRGNFYPSNSLIYSRGRDRCCLDGSKSGVSKKSLFFLLKKMFVCGSGFPPTPLFKDPVLSAESRMEKILRAILHKKIHPQDSSCSTTFIKMNLENNPLPLPDDDEEEEEELTAAVDKGSKWVRTDSEYIVLEI